MPIRVKKDKIILYKHTCNYELVKAVALDVKNSCNSDISNEARYKMQERLAKLDLYKTRNPQEKPLDSMNHRINTLEYWMFGYEYERKFIFSPLGNLFLSNINNDENLKKIFTTMLFSMQFQHPGSTMSDKFQLYFFRLIFKLLLDERLSGKLYNNEVELLLVFLEKVDLEIYEQLVSNIIKMRSLSNTEITELILKDEHTHVNTVHEWEYFTQRLLSQASIIEKHEGDILCKLYHPTKTNSKSKPTGRTATRGFISLNNDLKSFVGSLLSNYDFAQVLLKLNDEERLTIDVIKEIYSFYPKELLIEIGEFNEILDELLQLTQLIERYSNNDNDGDAYLFENVLTKGFNQFYNVEAKKIGGSSNTDIECLYTKSNSNNKKFAVDAKSTRNKLLNINSGRLALHRQKIGGEYTIVITSRYVPAVQYDILNSPIVIILASTFSEYLYNHISNDIREIDYKEFDEIIINNLGKDVSENISNLTLQKFGACA